MRDIFVKFCVDWDEYEDIADELMLDDLELDENIKSGVTYELVETLKPIASDAVLDDVRELIKCSDAMTKILLYNDKIFHRREMIVWQMQIEKVRAHVV